MVELVLFILMGAAAVAGAVAVVISRNTVHAAMGLLGTLFALAVVYVVNLAHLVAAVQVVVYAGAVMTLFLFVVMLIGVDKAEVLTETIPFQRQIAAGLAVILIGAGAAVGFSGRFSWVPAAVPDAPVPNGTVTEVARPLFTDWILPFEVTALLLTIAAIGAVALALFGRRTVE